MAEASPVSDNSPREDDFGVEEEPVKYTPFKLEKAALKQILADTEGSLQQDIDECEHLIDLFLKSRVQEAEDTLKPKFGRSLYYTFAAGVLGMIKSVMTCDAYDIAFALDAFRVTLEIVQAFRKEQTTLVGSFTGMLFGSSKNQKVNQLKQMTLLQKHIELIHAECGLLKALLYILTDPNMMGFVREGLTIRNAYSSYKVFYRYLTQVAEQGGLDDKELDQHFISGVYLGMGMFNLILSTLPKKLLRLFEMIGFGGHRAFGLKCLEIGANWPNKPMLKSISKTSSKYQKVVNFYPNGQDKLKGLGTRKFLCDLSLDMYHIVLSSMIQVPGGDFGYAMTELNKNITKTPDGFIYLILKGRGAQAQADPDEAIRLMERVVDIQQDWRPLVHVCFWDIASCHAGMGRWEKAAEYFSILFDENKWSRATCAYMKAVCLYEADAEKHKDIILDLMKQVPTLCKKVAGKSIPIEKYVARKSRKFLMQDNRLCLPGYEIIYMWAGFDMLPKQRLQELSQVFDQKLKALDAMQKKDTAPYKTYYDDLCLVRFLKGVTSRELVMPNASLLISEEAFVKRTVTPEQKKDLEYAARQLQFIALQADQIELDHWILPFSRYELGNLYVRLQEYEKGRSEYEAALAGGYAEDEHGQQRKKASMEQSLHLRVHNALVKLDLFEVYLGKKQGIEDQDQPSDDE
ncbi:hypothetical protein EDD86DRAFT_268666 [Gorgonomyces haynaldii]|nr:hypothetical protein EDD86DRAFT_268666 [Gorgonomyces haynaldii]